MAVMRRKTFIESQGATCQNWQWSWSFINAKEKFIIFAGNSGDGNSEEFRGQNSENSGDKN
jgi:5-methylcytosine-specific restriction protein A